MNHNYGNGVRSANGLGESARVDARVVLEGTYEEIGHDCNDGEQPHEGDQEQGVSVTVEFVVSETVANVAVTVDSDSCDVEYRADDAKAHQETAHHALSLPQ